MVTTSAYRAAFKSRRSLIAADGFYEWLKLDTGHPATEDYDAWLSPDTPANEASRCYGHTGAT